MNSLYFLLFIIVIPLAIFFITIFSDSQFEKLNISRKINSFFNNLSFNNQSNPNSNYTSVSKRVFSLNDGIGFGFGREFFACSNIDNLEGGCDNRNTDIGIVFHKFRMNDKYSVNCSESEEFFLNDYITEKYIKQNFVNILNNLWQPIETKFFFKELVTENEIDNLTKHYYSNPSEINHYHTDCGEYIRAKNNELKQDWDNISDKSLNGVFKPIPSINRRKASDRNLIQDSEKVNYAKMDVEIIKKLLANPELLGANSSDKQNEKQVLRSVFTRMTDETLYLNKYSRDLHIYLVPYIESDNSIIIEGKASGKSCLSDGSNSNNRPLFVMSMYHKECNIFKRTIDQFNADETCGMWLDKVNSDYNLMRKTERQFYTLAGFGDIPKSLTNCSPYKPNNNNLEQDEFNKLFVEEQELMNKIHANRKEQTPIKLDTNTDTTDMMSILNKKNKRIIDNENYKKEDLKKIDFNLKSSYTQEEIKSIINKNIQLMNKILEYDYLNDPRIRRLKKYKNKSLYRFEEVPEEYLTNITSPVGVTEPAYDGFIRKELKFTYRELVDLEIKKIKKEHDTKLELINNVNGLFKSKLDEVNQSTQPDRDKLATIQKQINNIISKRKGNMKELKNLKRILNKKRIEVDKPLFYAEKALPVIRANMLLLTMFGYTDTETLKDNIIFKNLYDGYEVCYILSKLLFPKLKVNKKEILNKKQEYSYLKMSTLNSIDFQFKQYIKVACIGSSDKIQTGDKCKFTNKSFCIKSKDYQIEDIHFEDLNSEYFVTLAEVEKLLTKRESSDDFTLSDQKHLEKLEMYLKDIEYKCLDCPCSNPTHHALENDYLKDNLLGDNSSDELKKNYEHLLKFLKDNNISMTKGDGGDNESKFITSIQTKHKSPIINTDIKNNIKSKLTKPAPGSIKPSCKGQGYKRSISKDYSVNDYMLNRVSNDNSDYLNSFTSSFI